MTISSSRLVLALLFLLSPAAVDAQTRIQAGQTLNGSLATSDPTLADDSHYDLYEYRGQAGERLRITMRSSAFDAYLAGGALQGGALTQEVTNDDGGGGTDSQLEVTVGASGVYGIRANSLSAGQTGAYTLTVELLGAEAATPAGQATGTRTISAGETVSSSLDTTDPTLGDGQRYETYVYRGRPGEQIVVIMRSSDFDSYLMGGANSEDTNDELSLQREERVKSDLVGQGIAAGRISIAGRGERDLIVPTDDGVDEPLNRRVEIDVR